MCVKNNFCSFTAIFHKSDLSKWHIIMVNLGGFVDTTSLLNHHALVALFQASI